MCSYLHVFLILCNFVDRIQTLFFLGSRSRRKENHGHLKDLHCRRNHHRHPHLITCINQFLDEPIVTEEEKIVPEEEAADEAVVELVEGGEHGRSGGLHVW